MSGSTASTAMKWTPQQLQAIRHVDGAMLVSAAAGSGKTAVLAERCAYLVCDAPEPCDVDELLVLTFTRAAAAEMRSRIDAVIRRKAEAPDAPPRIARQLRLIDRAQITTLDAFCGSLVRTHFHLVGVDPGFAVLAPEDATLLRNDVADALIEGEYDGPAAEAFRALLDGYFGSDDVDLRDEIIAAHALTQSIVDPDEWAAESVRRLREGAEANDSELLREYAGVQQREVRAAIGRLQQIARRARAFDGLAAYAAHCDKLTLELEDRLMLSEALRLDDLMNRTSSYQAPTLPRVKDDTPGKKPIQEEINAVKKRIKEGAIRRLCLFSSRQLRGDLASIAPLAAYFLDLVGRFGVAYDQAKRAARALDFADTETLALGILRAADDTPSPAALALHQRFRHVLVDEYQDINPLQDAILRMVSRDRAADLDPATRSNLFTVGDVKQSIYGFRLAEPMQFLNRQRRLAQDRAAGSLVLLQENFRSRAPLLSAVNDVFRLLMTRASAAIDYDASQELRAPGDYPPTPSTHFTGKPIELHLLPRELPPGDPDDGGDESPDSFEREIALVARRVRELVCADESQRPRVMVKGPAGLEPRPIRYGDIAVLLRTRRVKSSQLADALRSHGIPVHSDDATGFFSAVEVQDVLSVLRILSNGRQDIPLAAVIRSPFSPVTGNKDDALARIRLAFPDEPFHRAVVRYAGEVEDPLAHELDALLTQLRDWRRMFQERPVGESLLRLYQHGQFLTFCRALEDGAQRVANLQELQRHGEAFDAFERQGLDRFLAFLEELAVNDELGRPAVAAESADVVRIMTVHKSKGLEFPVVIVPDLGKRFNERSLSGPILLDRDRGVGMMAVDLERRVRYPSAASVVVRDAARRRAIAEEIRVLYVALTRAREHLILIGSAGADALAAWRDEWAGHDGPLPDEAIQDAATALDWLGPIAAITEARRLGTFAVTDRTATDNATPADTPAADKALPSCEQGDEPFPTSDALDDPIARAAVARIEFAYPHQAATGRPATMRVTDFLHQAVPEAPRPASIGLEWPGVYRPSKLPKANDIGTATHRLLQFIDFAGTKSPADVDAQIAALVERRLLSSTDAAIIDREAIAWFVRTPLADELRRPDVRLLREQTLAVAMPVIEDGADDDFALLRGRIDALVVRPEGLLLIDYKSDRVAPDQVDARAATYATQLLTYANALSAATGRRVSDAAFVFLHPRRIYPLALGGSAGGR